MENVPDADARGRLPEVAASALLAGMPFPAVLVSPDETIVASNPSADHLFGLTPASEREGALPRVPEGRWSDLWRRARQVASQPGETPMTHLDVNDLHMTLAPVESASHHLLGVLVLAADWRVEAGAGAPNTPAARDPARADVEDRVVRAMSELGHVKSALHTLGKKMETLELSTGVADHKTDFLAMLAHELRNPLAAIMNALHVVEHRLGDDRIARQDLKVADRQGLHQARLLDNLLDASRVVLGKIALRKERVDLGAVITNVLEAMQTLFQARAQEIALSLPDETLILNADPDRVEQIVRNLLDNALKYGGTAGRITIAVQREGGMATIRVRDTGIGIEPDMLPRIFDLFVQADSSLARSAGGLGIGLTLVRQLVELHGGSVSARSGGRNQGSEFEIRLPLAAILPASAGDAPGDSSRTPSRGRRHILVIEDNRDARQMLRMVLELRGHRVSDAPDGVTGIRMAVASAPAVILIDLGLPDMDGYVVAKRIRKRLGGQVVLIALTGYGDAESRQRSAAEGFDLHLVKPVSPDDLTRTLESL